MNFLRPLRQMDWILLFAAIVLSVIGIFFIFSASYQISRATGINFSHRQVAWLALGMGIFLILAMIDYHRLVSFAYPLLAATVLSLIFIALFGEIRYGARRWINLGGFTIQPSEFAKLVVILALSHYFAEKFAWRFRWRYVLVPAGMTAIPALLILKQPDLGTAIIFIPLLLGLTFIGRARMKHIIVIAVILMLLAPASWWLLKDYQRNRILVFLNPQRDPLGTGYTITQSKIAIGSGKISGKGWLAGTQNMLSFLPQRRTDFIFSVVAEEWGFVGSMTVLGLYALIIYRLFRIARAARDLTGVLLVTGGLIIFSTHVVINVGMALGLLPATGLPLPLLSYGGSVTVATLATLGLCQSVYCHRYWY